jgi:hypothetical protein
MLQATLTEQDRMLMSSRSGSSHPMPERQTGHHQHSMSYRASTSSKSARLLTGGRDPVLNRNPVSNQSVSSKSAHLLTGGHDSVFNRNPVSNQSVSSKSAHLLTGGHDSALYQNPVSNQSMSSKSAHLLTGGHDSVFNRNPVSNQSVSSKSAHLLTGGRGNPYHQHLMGYNAGVSSESTWQITCGDYLLSSSSRPNAPSSHEPTLQRQCHEEAARGIVREALYTGVLSK